MRKYFNGVAIALAMFIGSSAMAADKPTRGKVAEVAKDSTDRKLTDVTIHPRKGDDVVIKIGDSTKIMKAGAAATLADVTVGEIVSVTMDADKKVTEVDIMTPKKKTT